MKMTDSMTLSQGSQWQLRQNLFDIAPVQLVNIYKDFYRSYDLL